MAKCHHCGRALGAHPLDLGFTLPDVVWELDGDERERRAIFDNDLCELDGKRYFIRGVAFVPILNSAKHFGWGFWVEVSADVFDRYLELYGVDARDEPPATGRLANSPPEYPPSEGHPVEIRFATAGERPRITLDVSAHPLSLEQRNGMPIARLHEINASMRRAKSS